MLRIADSARPAIAPDEPCAARGTSSSVLAAPERPHRVSRHGVNEMACTPTGSFHSSLPVCAELDQDACFTAVDDHRLPVGGHEHRRVLQVPGFLLGWRSAGELTGDFTDADRRPA